MSNKVFKPIEQGKPGEELPKALKPIKIGVYGAEAGAKREVAKALKSVEL